MSVVAGIGLAATAIGAVASAAGAISSAQAQSANASYQAQVARNNAITAGQNAEYATRAGQEKAAETSLKAREQEGAVRAALAANNVDVNTGSAADVQTTQRETGVLGTQQVIDNAALQAYGYRTQATNFTAQAGLESAEAAQAPTAGALSATGDILSGASGTALNYVKLPGQTTPGATGTGAQPGTGIY